MKTIRFRLTRIILAVTVCSLCILCIVLKSTTDDWNSKSNIRSPLQVATEESNFLVPDKPVTPFIPQPQPPQDTPVINPFMNPVIVPPAFKPDQLQNQGPYGKKNHADEEQISQLLDSTNEGNNGPRGKGYPYLKSGKFIPPLRVVHFDLKGAAPRVSYFKEIFPLLEKLGANSVLLEWEDTFPYSGKLADAATSNHYTVEDIKTILRMANESNLEVIPLVQTFGHLEWILKFPKYQHLREVERFPQVICPSKTESIDLLKDMIDQVMKLHPDIRYFHMGADEAFQIGQCDACQKRIRDLGGNREKHMLKHIVTIASYVQEKYGKRVLMWHDMLNNVDPNLMKEYNLGELVEPVIWAYAENLDMYLFPDLWKRFSTVFPNIWGASAFKGADGPSRYYSNVPHYLQNHISWVNQMSNYWNLFSGEFRGLFVTGWQRYDHFAVLCELFPVGMPSLAVNMQTIVYGKYDRETLKSASKLLECDNTLDIDSKGVAASCRFPGFKAYQLIQQLRVAMEVLDTQLFDDYQLRGWISPFAQRHNWSSAWYLDQILPKLNLHHKEYSNLLLNIRDALDEIYFSDTADEFIYEYAMPHLRKMEDMLDAINRINSMITFPKRPFPILLDTTSKTNPPAVVTQNAIVGGSAV